MKCLNGEHVITWWCDDHKCKDGLQSRGVLHYYNFELESEEYLFGIYYASMKNC